MQLIPASIQRSTTSLRFFMKAAISSCLSGPSYGLISAADPIILSIRFQCPPMHTAETHRPVLPSRRYSIWGLKLRVLLTSSVTVSMEKLLVAGNPTDDGRRGCHARFHKATPSNSHIRHRFSPCLSEIVTTLRGCGILPAASSRMYAVNYGPLGPRRSRKLPVPAPHRDRRRNPGRSGVSHALAEAGATCGSRLDTSCQARLPSAGHGQLDGNGRTAKRTTTANGKTLAGIELASSNADR